MNVVLLCLITLRLNLWLQSRLLHEALRLFCKGRGAQQEQYPKLSVLSPAHECQLQRKLLCSLLITSILPQLLLCCCTFKVKVLASQRTAAYGIPLHRVLLTKAQPPGPFLAPNPMEQNLWPLESLEATVLATVLDASLSDPGEG